MTPSLKSRAHTESVLEVDGGGELQLLPPGGECGAREQRFEWPRCYHTSINCFTTGTHMCNDVTADANVMISTERGHFESVLHGPEQG